MKNIFRLLALLIICGCIISCGKDDCDKKITAVQPNTNPVGYEILIKTTGFTSAAKVVFGSVAATSRAGGEGGDLIAKVPAGLAGNVEISVEEGECIARSGGFVVGGLPTGVQPSLPVIVVPTTPTTLPTTGLNNNWPNVAVPDAKQGIHLNGDIVNGVASLEGAYEFDYLNNSTTQYFDGNPATGTLNTNTNVIYLEVNRTAKGGSIEKFDGQFIPVPSFFPAGKQFAISLVSRETGRQMLLYPL